MVRPIEPPGRIALDYNPPLTRLALLERVNALNVAGITDGDKYWTVTVLYNTVVYRQDFSGETHIVEVIEGVLK